MCCKIHPDRVMYMSEGEIRYLGDADGLMNAVDYQRGQTPGADDCQTRGQRSGSSADKVPARAGQATGSQLACPLVRFENVSFGYESEREVLHGISLDIKKGDVIAVLGPNGAGKTTFVKHAIGLLKPKAGQVLVNGKNTQRGQRGRDCQHARVCLPKPQPHAFCADGARGTGFWAEKPETQRRSD